MRVCASFHFVGQVELTLSDARCVACCLLQRRLQASCGDLNGDAVVNVDDLLAVLAAFGDVDASADLTGNPTERESSQGTWPPRRTLPPPLLNPRALSLTQLSPRAQPST